MINVCSHSYHDSAKMQSSLKAHPLVHIRAQCI